MATGKIKKPGLEVCKYTIANQTIASGGSLTVDVSSAVPDGKSIVGYCSVQIGNYMLPYLEYTKCLFFVDLIISIEHLLDLYAFVFDLFQFVFS